MKTDNILNSKLKNDILEKKLFNLFIYKKEKKKRNIPMKPPSPLSTRMTNCSSIVPAAEDAVQM